MRNTILFDLDQTLLDKHQTLIKFAKRQYKLFSLQKYATNKGTFIKEFVRLHQIVMPKVNVYKELTNTFSIDNSMIPKMLHDLNQHFPASSIGFPGLEDMLQSLKQKSYKIGIITNGRDFYQRNKIQALGISDYIDVIVTSGELGIKKPDVAIFYDMLGKLQSTPEQSIFVGDDLTKDIVPAKHLGMRTILMGQSQVHPGIDTNCRELSEVTLAVEKLSK